MTTPHQHSLSEKGSLPDHSQSHPHFGENRRVESSGEMAGTEFSAAICFGFFRLLPTQRLLLEGNVPVRIGSRALDILIALVGRPGELVSKEELMACVWPDTFVEPANLTVHIAALRRALGDGHGGNRFLINTPGRGYRFVAPISLREERRPPPPRPVTVDNLHNLPAPLNRLIGRNDVVAVISAQLCRDRLVTIAGAGGIGKTSVALAAAEKLIGNYQDGIWLIDLAPVTSAALVPSALASALRLNIRVGSLLADLVAALSDKDMLLIFDNCEHVVAAAAGLADAILRGARSVRVLATSREPLGTRGERIYRLPPLEGPKTTIRLGAEEALRCPTVQLFVERAAALAGFALSDADARVVADICGKLDGIPLAIELAAARVHPLGIRGLATRLNTPLSVLTNGCRTAPPRQRTMRASINWSYALLDEVEQVVLRRLSIFSGGFTLQAACAVISDDIGSNSEIIGNIAELAAKSLIASEVGGAERQMRLSDTTRSYAREKLIEGGEFDAIARRHSDFYRNVVKTAARQGSPTRRRA